MWKKKHKHSTLSWDIALQEFYNLMDKTILGKAALTQE